MLYPSAKVILHDLSDPSILHMIRREVDGVASYEPAGGKVEVDWLKRTGESLEACAMREAQEELGVEGIVDKYIGSYYFFWSIKPHAFSSCALFSGRVVKSDPSWKTNYDSCELTSIPVTVSVDDILTGKIYIDPIFIGLEELLLRYCRNYSKSQ